jgi:hypothetical protein
MGIRILLATVSTAVFGAAGVGQAGTTPTSFATSSAPYVLTSAGVSEASAICFLTHVLSWTSYGSEALLSGEGSVDCSAPISGIAISTRLEGPDVYDFNQDSCGACSSLGTLVGGVGTIESVYEQTSQQVLEAPPGEIWASGPPECIGYETPILNCTFVDTVITS